MENTSGICRGSSTRLVAAIGGGFLVDQLQHRRILILCLSMLTMGLGYLIVGLAPAYLLILVALGLVGIAHQSLWHPSALSLLSQRYPERRGFMVSMHRSSGNLGDAIGSIAVGALMLVLAWQGILLAAAERHMCNRQPSRFSNASPP